MRKRNALDGRMSFKYVEGLSATLQQRTPRSLADMDGIALRRAAEFGENTAEPMCRMFDFASKNVVPNRIKRSPKFGPYLYVFFTKTHFKIGVTNDPYDRLKTVQNGNPHRIGILNYWFATHPTDTERALHAELFEYRCEGEWFSAFGLVHASALISAFAHLGYLRAPNLDILHRRRNGRNEDRAEVGPAFPRIGRLPRWDLATEG